MRTPLGWARANVFYDMSRSVPTPGSLAEVLCLMVFKARQGQMVAGARAQAQAALGGDKAVEAFNDFKNLIHRTEIKDTKDRMAEAMEELKEIKEIRFRPLKATTKSATALKSVDRGKYLNERRDTSTVLDNKPAPEQRLAQTRRDKRNR